MSFVGRVISVSYLPPRWLYVKSENETSVSGYLFSTQTKRWIGWEISFPKALINAEPHDPIAPKWISEESMYKAMIK